MKFLNRALLLLCMIFLISGCRGAQEAKMPTVAEELDCLSVLADEVSSDVALELAVDDYEMHCRFFDLVQEYVWDQLKSMEDIPQPDDLNRYFARLEDMVAVADWHYDTYSSTAKADKRQVVEQFYNAIDLLQKYAEGQLTQYPARALKDEIDSIFAVEWMLESESGYDEYWALFVYRLLQQAVRYCPDISMLCDFVSEDGRIGIYDNTLRDDTYQPCFNPVFICGEDGQWRVYINEMFLPNRAYRLVNDNDVYYLLSKHGDSICSKGYDKFDVRLIYESEYGFDEQLCLNDEYLDAISDWLSDAEEPFVLFDPDPNKLTWTVCDRNGKYFHKIPGSPILKLAFRDGFVLFELL